MLLNLQLVHYVPRAEKQRMILIKIILFAKNMTKIEHSEETVGRDSKATKVALRTVHGT